MEVAAQCLSEEIVEKLVSADSLYHRLVLIVGPPGAGKTLALQEVARTVRVPVINVNLELARRMLDLTERQCTLQVQRLLEHIVAESERDAILLDNLEILFDIALRQDPLRLVQGLSRSRTVVATWNGSIENDYLFYATPQHPEYRRYEVAGFLVVRTEADD